MEVMGGSRTAHDPPKTAHDARKTAHDPRKTAHDAPNDARRGGSRTAPTDKRKSVGRLIGVFKTVSTKHINKKYFTRVTNYGNATITNIFHAIMPNKGSNKLCLKN